MSASFGATGAKVVVQSSHAAPPQIIEFEWQGSHPGTALEGRELLAGKINYLIGDKTAWRKDVPTYSRVHYTQLYPKIDLDFYGNEGKLEYDLILRSGSDPEKLQLRIRGQHSLRITEEGDLAIEVTGGEIIQQKPICYQMSGAKRRLVAGRYVLTGKDTLKFKLASYDRQQPLIIDPTLVYSAAIGTSTGIDYVSDIAIDGAGNTYIAGNTTGTDFPLLNWYQLTGIQGPAKIFLAKFNPAGTGLLYATYFGGNAGASVARLALDTGGNIVFNGTTLSGTFPISPGARSCTLGVRNGFLTKLNSAGNGLVFSTCLVASTGDVIGSALTLDGSGNIYAAGYTQGTDFATTPGSFQTTFSGLYQQGYIVKFSPAGGIIYSTLLGGNGWTAINDIAVDTSGSAYVTGQTTSTNFPTTAGSYQPDATFQYPSDNRAFVTKLNPSGSGLVFSTYIFSPYRASSASSIALDSNRSVYLTGSGDVPTTPGVLNTTLAGNLFALKMDPTGSTLLYSTYLAGTLSGGGLAVDSSGNAVIVGAANSVNFPVMPGAPQITSAAAIGGSSAFVMKLNATATGILFSTFLGDNTAASRAALDGAGNTYVTGTNFGWLPTTPGAYKATSGADIFIVKLSEQTSCSFSLSSGTQSFGLAAASAIVNVNTSQGCNWIVENSASWASVDKTVASGPDAVTVSVRSNPSPARTATLSIAGQPFTVSQPYGCTFSMPITSQGFTASGTSLGGSATFPLITGPGCYFPVTTNASWIIIDTWVIGPSGYVAYEVMPYTGLTSRTATITAAGQTFTVIQRKDPCSFQLSQTVISGGPQPLSGSISITTDSTCAWTAYSQTGWLFAGPNSGQGNGTVTYSTYQNTSYARTGQILIAGQTVSVSQSVGFGISVASRFVPLTPCRVVDTRRPVGPVGGPSLSAATSREFPLPAGTCNLPVDAAAYSINVTVVPQGQLSYLTIWPTGLPQPYVSTLNSFDGRIKANAAIVPSGASGSVSVYATHATDVILDINGFFTSAVDPSTLQFYSVAPCRVADTRNANGPLSGPALKSGQARTFPVLSSNCSIPASAKAYSLNMTTVPLGPLDWLSVWPTGTAWPGVSTLNAPTGAVSANAAIVPAGSSGSIDVLTPSPAQMIIDINGYFAPPGSPGALSFFATTPCRIADTRNDPGPFGGPIINGNSSRSFAITQGQCGIPATATAYSLNATVVPSGFLGYMTLWPSGLAQPIASTLNSWDATVVSNAALVPAGTQGSVTALMSDSATHLILDVNGYFAPQ